MRNRMRGLKPVAGHLGKLLQIFAFVLLIPAGVLLSQRLQGRTDISLLSYLAPAAAALLAGTLLSVFSGGDQRINGRRAMLVCALGWIVISAFGAFPFWLGVEGLSFLDACSEAVNGFTTTGITMLDGLDDMPVSIIFWRSFIQWLGGVGILTFFLVVSYAGGTAHTLFSAESHKIFSKRPAPGMYRTLQITWTIYLAFTVLIAALLALAGMSFFDAVVHAFTTISTGGYSHYDASIAHFREVQYPHYAAIEWIIILGMFLGGISFLVHFRVLTAGVTALWDNFELKLFWGIVAAAVALVMIASARTSGTEPGADDFRETLFQVTSIATSTGFLTRSIDGETYPALAKIVFLVLMVIGGCVGSTSGGFKVLRIGVLLKMISRQCRRVVHGPMAVELILVDGEQVQAEEVRRVSALFFAWVLLLLAGSCITALFSSHGPFESASGMFSALGNIGPCYISPEGMRELSPVIKLTYMAGMLAGRLEILPILLLFNRKSWC